MVAVTEPRTLSLFNCLAVAVRFFLKILILLSLKGCWASLIKCMSSNHDVCNVRNVDDVDVPEYW